MIPAENLVLTEIICSGLDQPYYWTSDAAAEVEYIIQAGTGIVPVEVKSAVNSIDIKSLTKKEKIVLMEQVFD